MHGESWSNPPAIAITIGSGGAAGPDGATAGNAGRVIYQASAAADAEAHAIARVPTTGTFTVTSGVAGNLPDLGFGLWVLTPQNENTGPMPFGNITTGGQGQIYPRDQRMVTFIGGRTDVCTYSTPTDTRTIRYAHFAMGARPA